MGERQTDRERKGEREKFEKKSRTHKLSVLIRNFFGTGVELPPSAHPKDLLGV